MRTRIGSGAGRGRGVCRAGLLSSSVLLALAFGPLAGAGQAVDVSVLSDLSMGQVLAGTTVTVAHTDGEAAQFLVQGPGRAVVELTFALPARVATGSVTLPVSFGPESAAWGHQDRVGGRTVFDPAHEQTVQLPPNGRLFVWVGAVAAPPLSQQAGQYDGPLTLQVQLQEEQE